jgi:hypothetical protein
MLPAARRLPAVHGLVELGKYFVVHAPRQAGKTTSLSALARELTATGQYAAVLLSMEVGAPFDSDPGTAEASILTEWRRAIEARLPPELQPGPWAPGAPGAQISTAVSAWSRSSPRPLVLFLDEIDALRDRALLSVLRQLRSGYGDRPGRFPWSVALVGLRDVRDYRIHLEGNENLGTASPFNILTESLKLGAFDRGDIAELYAQHTAETGQRFLDDAVDRAMDLTGGQPWLVNAIARQAVEVVVPDPSRPIDVAAVDRAKELLIERRDTHIDSLAANLRDRRVRAVLEPMLAGSALGDVPDDDRQYVVDLGLVRREPDGGLAVANPIYREVIVRALAGGARDSLPSIHPTWLTSDGRLDADRLLTALVDFWRQHGEALLGTAPYHEIAPHLVLMAFLHRVVNGGGTVDREYAIGRGRMDLVVRYGAERVAIEVKVWRDGRPDPITDGLEQLDAYLAGLGLDRGWLVLFDRRSAAAPIQERTVVERRATRSGRTVDVVRA